MATSKKQIIVRKQYNVLSTPHVIFFGQTQKRLPIASLKDDEFIFFCGCTFHNLNQGSVFSLFVLCLILCYIQPQYNLRS